MEESMREISTTKSISRPVKVELLPDAAVTVTLNSSTTSVNVPEIYSQCQIDANMSSIKSKVKVETMASETYLQGLETAMTRNLNSGIVQDLAKLKFEQLPKVVSMTSNNRDSDNVTSVPLTSQRASPIKNSHFPYTDNQLILKHTEQSRRCAALIQRIRVIQEEVIEAHVRQQMNVLVRETGIDPSLLPPSEDRVVIQEEGRRRKSVSVSSCGTTYTYGNDDGGSGLELGLAPSPTAKQATPHSLSERDVNQLERMSSLLSMTLEERVSMPSPSPISNSEETESSSENSSDDDDYSREPETVYNYLPVEDDPKTKWANDRAQLICLWTWIRDSFANVSHHLEQQNEIYKHIKSTKTPIQFEQPTCDEIPHDLSISSSALKDAIVEVYKKESGPPSVTYVHAHSAGSVSNFSSSASANSSKGASASVGEDRDRIRIGGGLGKLNIDFGTTTDEGCTSRRCLPLQTIKRRKIYHLSGIKDVAFQGKVPALEMSHIVEVRSSTSIGTPLIHSLACSCFGRVELCSLCLNRSSKAKLIDCDVMSGREILSNLDYCSHESLSLRDETRFDLLVDSSLKLGTWKKNKEYRRYNFLPFTHTRVGATETKSEYSDEVYPEKLEKRGRGRPRLIPDKSKLEETKRKFSNSRKLARIQRGSFGERVKPLIARRQFKKRKHTFSKLKDEDSFGLEDDYASQLGDIEEEYSWRPPTIPGKFKKDRTVSSSEQYKRTRRDQDFDIDNIVIPYSIASATRVEKIEYKEIITPSWRSVQEEVHRKTSIGEDSGSDREDLSEQTIAARHDRSEVEEHKKFSATPASSRRARRIDSKTESFDTPDAMSPLMLDVNVHTSGGDTLPPSPTAGYLDEPQSMNMTAADASLALTALKLSTTAASRRRTTSATKKDEEMYMEEDDGLVPFEPRKFPLDDDDYEEMLNEMPDDFMLSPPKPEQDLLKSSTLDNVSGGVQPETTDTSLLSYTQSDKDDDSSADENDPDWEFVEGDR